MNPLLSICILTYNRAPTLRATLDSILPQVSAEPRIEVVVSDNASTDNTPTVIQEFSERYASLRYHRNPQNLGFDGNVIACIEQARGAYVAFFSDDDIALPNTFQRIAAELDARAPAILYLNHYSFWTDVYFANTGAKHPEQDRVFQDGKTFLLFAGLGFISALTVKTAYAREFIANVKLGRGQAHLDIAARISLLKPGPFIFLGTQSVAARATPPAYDSVTYAAMGEAIFYHELGEAGLLDATSVKRRVGRSIRHNLFRAVLVKKCIGDAHSLATQKDTLCRIYGRYLQFYLFVYPVLILPRALLKPPYVLGRTLMRRRGR